MPGALFTTAELTAWTSSPVTTDTFTLVLELVTTAIRGAVGATTYDALVDVAPLKLIALDLARRMLRNGEGLRSVTKQLDDYSRTFTYASETLATPDLTTDDVERIWRALGFPAGQAFTIRPAGQPDLCPDLAPRRCRP